MSIKVTDFKWEKGKNDLEYIALLEKNLDAMMYKFRECAKVAKEQYNKGRESAFKEIAYSDGLIKESDYEKRIRADERAKINDELSEIQQILILFDVDTAEKRREIVDMLEQIKAHK